MIVDDYSRQVRQFSIAALAVKMVAAVHSRVESVNQMLVHS
jgi:hypothetical protein